MADSCFLSGELLTTKQVAARVGLQRYQLTYRIDRGIIADSKLRIANRRLFSEEEVQAIEQTLKSDQSVSR